MEMVIGGMASMFLAYRVGRAMRLSDVQIIIMITMAGVGCCVTGLAYLWIADVITGESASPMWIVTGLIGGVLGIFTYILSRYLPWVVEVGKKNGLL